jgi:hypothetical protein
MTYLDASPGRRTQALLPRLAVASQQPPTSLSHALVEFQYLDTRPRPRQGAFPRRWNEHGAALKACRLCMAARGITTSVEVFVPSYQRVCLRHRRWLDRSQVDLANAPEVLDAQRQHRWIFRRQGRRNAGYGYGDAEHIVGRWLRRLDHDGLHRRWDDRLTRLGETRRVLEFDDPVLHAATYPETVVLGSILASPFWISMATSNHAVNRDRFYREAARRFGVPSVHPTDGYDPLFQWSVDLALQARGNVARTASMGQIE